MKASGHSSSEMVHRYDRTDIADNVTGPIYYSENSLIALLSSDLYNLYHHVSEISQINFFLIGAMTLVELIDSHRGFKIITDRLRTRSKRKILWIISFVSFFLSAVLDNLTTTILIVSLLRKLIPDRKERFLMVCIVVVAANAGGAWTPIGEMLQPQCSGSMVDFLVLLS